MADRSKYLGGNYVDLLENGEAFFPALESAIAVAREFVWIETYIYANDPVGRRIRDLLTTTAARGIQIRVVVDGFGSVSLPREWWQPLEQAGGEIRVYRREHGVWPLRRTRLMRLHRKLCVVDGQVAFAGGINIQDDWDIPGQTAARFDFAVQVKGPLVARIASAMERLWWRLHWRHAPFLTRRAVGEAHLAVARQGPGVRAALLLRDNLRNRHAIERAYLRAIGRARHDVMIANAYFLPGRRFRRALLHAAQRGVRVRLLLQGMVEYRLQHAATNALYGPLLDAGIEINEYQPSHLHAKVAVVDGYWSTVGSSNIDPFSLLLAREANVAIEDRQFSKILASRLEWAMENQSNRIEANAWRKQSLLWRLKSWLAYALVRWGMGIAGLLRQWK